MYALPRPAGSVDTVVLHQVLHFADDPAAVIGESARVLAPGGQLLVIDFMPHNREELRERQRHVRLGFAEPQVLGWMAAAGLEAEIAAQLPAPQALGVTLWRGRRPAPAQREAA
jgi:ArsR family transcriptional regulator